MFGYPIALLTSTHSTDSMPAMAAKEASTSSVPPFFSSQGNVNLNAFNPNATGSISAFMPTSPVNSLILENTSSRIRSRSSSGEVGIILNVMIAVPMV